ncbi:hypothetical protein L3Q82_009101 [Scortum barcoo]|uniref:Uncharacterized protein n=1 Tax=Scortum barcoo TaxID=214431 RepID=A0ACB8XB32_9TELE|nr:hypothetical protein L3Q82_009101 [Scortum barcoo]
MFPANSSTNANGMVVSQRRVNGCTPQPRLSPPLHSHTGGPTEHPSARRVRSDPGGGPLSFPGYSSTIASMPGPHLSGVPCVTLLRLVLLLLPPPPPPPAPVEKAAATVRSALRARSSRRWSPAGTTSSVWNVPIVSVRGVSPNALSATPASLRLYVYFHKKLLAISLVITVELYSLSGQVWVTSTGFHLAL